MADGKSVARIRKKSYTLCCAKRRKRIRICCVTLTKLLTNLNYRNIAKRICRKHLRSADISPWPQAYRLKLSTLFFSPRFPFLSSYLGKGISIPCTVEYRPIQTSGSASLDRPTCPLTPLAGCDATACVTNTSPWRGDQYRTVWFLSPESRDVTLRIDVLGLRTSANFWGGNIWRYRYFGKYEQIGNCKMASARNILVAFELMWLISQVV
jgi:hypothetical protein